MLDHAADLLTLMIWAFSTLGALGVGVAAWGGRKVLERLDRIESLLSDEVRKLTELHHALDKRVTIIEERCHLMHESRRHDDPPEGPAPVRY